MSLSTDLFVCLHCGFMAQSTHLGHVDRLCWGLMKHQPLWVILWCLPRKGERRVEEMKREGQERRRNRNEKKK